MGKDGKILGLLYWKSGAKRYTIMFKCVSMIGGSFVMSKIIRSYHAVRQVLEGKRLVEDEAKYRIICLGAAFIHFVFAACMFIINADVLFYYNAIIVVGYTYMGLSLAPKGKVTAIQLLLFAEIELHAALATCLLGIDYGFMLYTVALIPMAFYLSHSDAGKPGHLKFAVTISVFVIAGYLAVSIMQPRVTFKYDTSAYEAFKIGLRYFNIFIAFLLQLSFSLLFALETEYMSGLLANENVKLSEDASHDPLTRLWNRRSLTNAVEEAIGLMERIEVFSVVMMDIDDFKHVNDTYGHDVGDTVLVALADIIREEVRAGDYSCRWGGEEFLLFAHGPRNEVQFVAERILERFRSTEFSDGKGNTFGVTLTAGVAEYRYGAQLRNVIDAADKRLYYGKAHGKNQIVSAS